MAWPFRSRWEGRGIADLEQGPRHVSPEEQLGSGQAQVLGAKLMLLLAATFLLVSPALKSDWAVYVLPYAAFQLLLLTILLLRGLCTEGPKASPKTPVFRIWAKLPALPAEEVASEVPQFLVHEITCKNMKAVIERTGPCVGAKMGACPRLGSCCICMDDADMVAMLPCGHTFCEPCIAQWSMSGSEYSGKCPVCRADFGAAALDG
ncbi:RNF141 [Symbiodinium pilosum]|uniref:RNF141 protein n=1 Tax=Symbiodinium pilosum TaxID=2952 RepID=A0A812NFT1_SYMPI|nr:RNF141 [Symbiodinium pilosum]